MSNVQVSELRKNIALAFVTRAFNLGLNEARRKIEARAFFLGAEQALKLRGDDLGAQNMRDAYSTLVETGFKTVLKWAGIDEVVEAKTEDKEAALVKAA